MSITTSSIDKSIKLAEIGFPEFTAKLIGDVFNAIVSANMSQTQAYIELTKQLSKTLDKYIGDTQGDISGTDILNFLIKVAPSIGSASGTLIRSTNSDLLTKDQANKINEAVSIPNATINTQVANTTSTIQELYPYILDSVASKIAAEKYNLLQKMVNQGLVRIIINSGEMSTMLNFQAKDSAFYQSQSKEYDREVYTFRSNVASADRTTEWNNYAVSTKYSALGVGTITTDQTQVQSNTSSVQVTGSVKLNFSTDYQPLNPNS